MKKYLILFFIGVVFVEACFYIFAARITGISIGMFHLAVLGVTSAGATFDEKYFRIKLTMLAAFTYFFLSYSTAATLLQCIGVSLITCALRTMVIASLRRWLIKLRIRRIGELVVVLIRDVLEGRVKIKTEVGSSNPENYNPQNRIREHFSEGTNWN